VNNNVKKSVPLKPIKKNKLLSNEKKSDKGRAPNIKTVKSEEEKSKKEVKEKNFDSDKENLSLTEELEMKLNITFEIECKEETPLKTPSKNSKHT
jgi:hypothetical protein